MVSSYSSGGTGNINFILEMFLLMDVQILQVPVVVAL